MYIMYTIYTFKKFLIITSSTIVSECYRLSENRSGQKQTESVSIR